ncbi:Signal recognition particle subunit SRP72 [Entomophthora muscae]|uniref:Signal recognition particle subunit SRP72 n=1 Tax=Entomophthora muscae TaxID=34485 RepID=A0ACC2S8P0_9FUNG|nr:Signal recognition particle subunit SRP72 [Entomophthora muscae]
MASQSEEITSLFKEALDALSELKYSVALESLDKIIELCPKDVDASRTKAMILIKEEKFLKGFEMLEKLEKISPKESSLPFAKAYCLCSLNRLQEAHKEINKAKDAQSFAVKNLKGQIAFKMEDFPTCINIYYGLVQETPETHPEYQELLANCQAAIGASLLSDKPITYKTIDSSLLTHEILFNMACIAIAEDNLEKANKLLQDATSLCVRVLEEELCSKEEIYQELAPIKLQQAYIKQLQGDISGSGQIYSELLSNKLDNPSLTTIATNNMLSTQDLDEKVFETLHTLKQQIASDPKSSHRLLKKQNALLAGNEVALFLSLKKFPHSFSKAKKMESLHPSGYRKIHPALVHFHSKKPKLAVTELQKRIKEDAASIPLNFALAQLYIQDNRYDLAIDQLEALRNNLKGAENKVLPGLIGALAWLYEQTANLAKAESLLDSATKEDSPYREIYQSVFKRKQAYALLDNNQPEAEAAQFQALLSANSEDLESFRGLIKAFSLYDPATAEQYLESYSKPSLESASLEANYLKSLKQPAQFTSANLAKKAKAKKNNRRNRPPKKMNANGKPDVQRWLPMTERSYYKNKSNKLMRGNQGASVAEVKEEPVVPKAPASSTKAKTPKSKKKKGGK